MNTRSQFIDFFYNNLLTQRDTLVKRHRALLFWGSVTSLLLGMVTVSLFTSHTLPSTLPYIGASFFIITLIIVLIFQPSWKRYRNDFKTTLIAPLITQFSSELSYDHDKYIPEELFNLSHLFDKTPERYTGDDLIAGMIDNVQIVCSDIHAQYKTYNSKGQTQWHTIFEGLFFYADFPKSFLGTTIVTANQSERFLGVVGSWLKSLQRNGYTHITMDNPLFERYFSVYTTDRIEAHYLLSTTLLERLVTFRTKNSTPLWVSFTAGKLFIAFSKRHRLEPTLFNPTLDHHRLKAFYDDLKLLFDFVHEFQLSLAIWKNAPKDQDSERRS